MAVDAAERCLGGTDRSRIDAIYFASTSAPYVERHAAGIVAAALDLREGIATVDFADTLRAGTAALRAARDAVVSDSAREVLVIASDRRIGEPESVFEQLVGDGAAAILVGRESADALASIATITSHADDVTGGWRRAGDSYLRSFSPKHEVEYGFQQPLLRALSMAARDAEIDPSSARLAVPTIDGRAHLKVAAALGISFDRVADPCALVLGVLGTPAPFFALANALEAAAPAGKIFLGAVGEGADAVVLEVQRSLRPEEWRPSEELDSKRSISSYGELVRSEGLLQTPTPRIDSSPVTYWRERRENLNLHGMRCRACGLVQYPLARVCRRCHEVGTGEEVTLSRRGRVFTYTLDHVVAASYSTIPVPRVIVDLEGGGRILTQMTDCEAQEITVGMPVDLVFRRMNEGGDFVNYYWKARPARLAPGNLKAA